MRAGAGSISARGLLGYMRSKLAGFYECNSDLHLHLHLFFLLRVKIFAHRLGPWPDVLGDRNPISHIEQASG